MMMKSPFSTEEVDAAVADLRKAADRLVELMLRLDPLQATRAVEALSEARYIVADAARAAFPRTECPFLRDRLIYVIDAMSPPEDSETQGFLRRVAAEDPDEHVRIYAEEVYEILKERESWEPAFW